MRENMPLEFMFFFIPTVCLVVGGLGATFYKASPQFTSMAQHFAAGVVFAAVAKELLPKIGAAHAILPLIVGFSLGVLLMFLTKGFSQILEQKQIGKENLALNLIFAVWIDVFIDGMIIGIAFLAGEQGGILITCALAIELLFLGLSTVATLTAKKAARWYCIFITLLLAITVPVASFLGTHFFAHASVPVMNGILSFGVAALLYLVVEELLIEAHQREEKIWMPLFFFAGFLLILLLE